MASPPPRTPPLPISIFLFLLHPLALADGASFDFPSFSFRNLTLLGDSFLRNGTVGLTRETDVPSSSCGTAAYNLPVRFRDPKTNTTASFSTNFTFSITGPNPTGSHGDGLTFFISPSGLTLGGTGGYLGLFNASSRADNGSVVVGVEFDTRLDRGFDDPSENHVGVDVGSPVSVGTADLAGLVDLKSGNPITAWIDYHQEEEEEGSLKVWLGDSSSRPGTTPALLSVTLDLSKHFEEYMYVGFSASTEGSTEVHTVERWSFETYGLPAFAPTSEKKKKKKKKPPQNLTNTSSWGVNVMIPAMPITNSTTTTTTKSHRHLNFGLQILGHFTFAAAFVVILWLSVKKGMKFKAKRAGLKPDFLRGPRQFSYRELKHSTRGFSGDRILGNGAFGTVYRGVDPKSGATYAVKRSKQAHESRAELGAELAVIASLRHKNLVQLQGWCSEKDELLLVYEFMPNSSLDRVLYPRPGSGPCRPALGWERRYNVAVGVASVLAYLHRECDQRVIHRDIKTSNIMLDSELNPRLGDFGLARLMDHNKSPVSTLTAGTMGYLAPEYLQYGKFTEKTDVFSYGVVVLEVCCGRRPIDREGEGEGEGKGKDQKLVNLVDWVWALYSQDKLVQCVDERLEDEFDGEKMLRLLLVGLSCVNPKCDERPSMRRVLQILSGEAEPSLVPKAKPLLLFGCGGGGAGLSLQEIVLDMEASTASSSLCEIKFD